MRGTVGAWMMGVGVLHEFVGLAVGGTHLVDIVQAGVFNAVTDDQPFRMAIFWFEISGLFMILLGYSWHQMELRGVPVDRTMAIALFATAVLGVICMPVSGFWTLFALAGLVWWRAPTQVIGATA